MVVSSSISPPPVPAFSAQFRNTGGNEPVVSKSPFKYTSMLFGCIKPAISRDRGEPAKSSCGIYTTGDVSRMRSNIDGLSIDQKGYTANSYLQSCLQQSQHT